MGQRVKFTSKKGRCLWESVGFEKLITLRFNIMLEHLT